MTAIPLEAKAAAAPGIVSKRLILVVRYACGHSFEQRPDAPIRPVCPCWPGDTQ